MNSTEQPQEIPLEEKKSKLQRMREGLNNDEGMTKSEICQKYDVSPATLENYLENEFYGAAWFDNRGLLTIDHNSYKEITKAEPTHFVVSEASQSEDILKRKARINNPDFLEGKGLASGKDVMNTGSNRFLHQLNEFFLGTDVLSREADMEVIDELNRSENVKGTRIS